MKGLSSRRSWSVLTQFWRIYRKNRAATYCLPIILFFVFLAMFGPIIAPYRPQTTGVGPAVQPPDLQFPMGTDDLGRDVLSGVLWGARVSLAVGILASLIATSVGIVMGAVSGFYGGLIDDTLMRITEVFLVIPSFVLALILVATLGASIWNIILVIGVLSWPSTARIVRGEFLSLREREYVLAARAIGEGNRALIFRELLPNAITTVIPNGVLQVSSAILLEAGVSFLGLGDPNVPSWGMMLNSAMQILRSAWWPGLFPGIALSSLAIALNLMGDGLNDALNPKAY